MRRFLLPCVVAVLGACATPIVEQQTPAADVTPFSSNRSGTSPPRGWHRWIITRNKIRTRYELVVDPLSQRMVLLADADMAASGLMQGLDVDPRERPRIAWSWRVPRLIDGADNRDRNVEDAPARLLLFFDGDRAQLPLREQIALFGERPGRLIGVGILTDTDNTKAHIEAFYGDIRLQAAGG